MSLSKAVWKLRDITRQIWTRVALYSLLALVSAGIAPVLSPFLPDGLKNLMGEEPTLQLLSILTNSMLVVATFSLSVMVAAHQFAASQATPRSHRLLREDGRTQSVLATFIGAFVFGLTSRIVINAGLYGDLDFPVIYFVTIVVTLTVILALIRWVQQLAALGSIEKTTGRVEATTRDALMAMAKAPYLGCTPLPIDEAARGRELQGSAFGYVRYIDVNGLSDCAGKDGQIDVLVVPGDWVGPGDPVLCVAKAEADDDDLLDNIVIGELRSFDQDPVFGLQVMSEIGQRALSPGLNDPQTAVDVINRQSRLLDLWSSKPVDDPLPGLRVRQASGSEAMHVAFDTIARDGSALLEVQLTLQKALARLESHQDPEIRLAAREVSRRALERSDAALELSEDRDAVRAAAP
ncbi:Uncharacterized membrane protein [Jannaschia faecimaris]|uniref:Uncharacterized membrane protein n=1 Tax=Jannaschia faecimaris TaxID=1244108 RepID=A0A1H3PHR9_9RHOB|nr:DUF2254 domain-containing protein [Jannaschia faecimaris]SDZ00650.1 Uncharacterized membrane protein [Jannaschia faecimaris]